MSAIRSIASSTTKMPDLLTIDAYTEHENVKSYPILILKFKEIKIIVNDDGPGLPDDIIKKIGEPYIKSKSIELSSNSGLGLGTFLGKTLLERQGANLSFRRNNDLGGALVIIRWDPKKLINS